MAEDAAVTPYDEVAYPAMVCTAGHPDKLATIARLHGLSPAPIATARVLEIGGGDGVNLIALAAAYPHASFLSIDLSREAVRRGQAIVSKTGLANVRVEQGDIVELAATLDGMFDYVIAHGVYAWVPPVVRPAVMVLAARVLAPQGIAFIDYNAMPGGHIRQTLREMMLYGTAEIADPIERNRAAHAMLVDYGRPREGERASVTALREQARLVAQKSAGVLHHDELGAWFDPQMFADVVAEAEQAGLAFLNEADPLVWEDGFAAADAPDADLASIVRNAQLRDYESMKFFRQSLFVQADAAPSRRPILAAVPDLYIASQAEHRGDGVFAFDGGSITISDGPFADAFALVLQNWPARIKVADLFSHPEWHETLYELAGLRFVSLHTVPREGVLVAGERPLASSLARVQAAADEELITTLDLLTAPLREAGPRAFLALLDGTRTRDELAAAWQRTPFAQQTRIDDALDALARVALLVR
jgi:SAM-dependent methyltransferase